MATDRHQAPSYPLRMPDELKVQLQKAADAEGRSLHAELLYRLQQSFDPGREVFMTSGMFEQINLIMQELLAEVKEFRKLNGPLPEHLMPKRAPYSKPKPKPKP